MLSYVSVVATERHARWPSCESFGIINIEKKGFRYRYRIPKNSYVYVDYCLAMFYLKVMLYVYLYMPVCPSVRPSVCDY